MSIETLESETKKKYIDITKSINQLYGFILDKLRFQVLSFKKKIK